MRLQVRANTFFNFIEFSIMGIVYIMIYYGYFRLSFGTFGFAIMHVLIASLLMTMLMSSFTYQYKHDSVSIVTITIWLILIYYFVSAIKYPTSFFSDFNSSASFRFLGSLVVGVSILFALLVNWKGVKYKLLFAGYRIPTIFTWIFIIYLFYIKIISPDFVYSDSSENVDVLNMVLSNTFSAIMIICAAQNISEKNMSVDGVKHTNISKFKEYIPVFLIVILYFIGSIITGQRSAMFLPVFELIAIVILRKMTCVQNLVRISSLIPIIYMGYSIVAFNVSGRLGSGGWNTYAATLGYRCDLADFANEIAANTSFGTRNGVRSIVEGILNALPSALFSIDKSSFQRGGGGAYDHLVRTAGLGTTDYGSNVFVMGASIAGYIGIILSLSIIVIFFRQIESAVRRRSKNAFFYSGILVYYYMQIEIYWTSFFSRILWCVISVIICRFFLQLCNLLWWNKKTKNMSKEPFKTD